MQKNGLFVISLDFELNWGVFDSVTGDSYTKNLQNVPLVIERLLKLSNKYNINLTFAIVGMLFHQNKDELVNNLPTIKPEYKFDKFNAYALIKNIGFSEKEDKLHYAASLIELIRAVPKHEIASHTYSHFYCKELGQNANSFENDLKSFSTISENRGINLKSIVFPKNQINKDYLNLCKKYGISSYRGTENSILYKPVRQVDSNLGIRFLRLVDSYLNISGYHIYKPVDLKTNHLINIPSSRFLRPYNKKLNYLETLKISRIKKAMNKAAKENSIYHLWWHPHNFGVNMEENFNNLEEIFSEYESLSKRFNFKSVTMSETHKIIVNS